MSQMFTNAMRNEAIRRNGQGLMGGCCGNGLIGGAWKGNQWFLSEDDESRYLQSQSQAQKDRLHNKLMEGAVIKERNPDYRTKAQGGDPKDKAKNNMYLPARMVSGPEYETYYKKYIIPKIVGRIAQKDLMLKLSGMKLDELNQARRLAGKKLLKKLPVNERCLLKCESGMLSRSMKSQELSKPRNERNMDRVYNLDARAAYVPGKGGSNAPRGKMTEDQKKIAKQGRDKYYANLLLTTTKDKLTKADMKAAREAGYEAVKRKGFSALEEFKDPGFWRDIPGVIPELIVPGNIIPEPPSYVPSSIANIRRRFKVIKRIPPVLPLNIPTRNPIPESISSFLSDVEPVRPRLEEIKQNIPPTLFQKFVSRIPGRPSNILLRPKFDIDKKTGRSIVDDSKKNRQKYIAYSGGIQRYRQDIADRVRQDPSNPNPNTDDYYYQIFGKAYGAGMEEEV